MTKYSDTYLYLLDLLSEVYQNSVGQDEDMRERILLRMGFVEIEGLINDLKLPGWFYYFVNTAKRFMEVEMNEIGVVHRLIFQGIDGEEIVVAARHDKHEILRFRNHFEVFVDGRMIVRISESPTGANEPDYEALFELFDRVMDIKMKRKI